MSYFCLLGNIFVSVLVRLLCWKVATELEAEEFLAGAAPASTAPTWPCCGEGLARISCTCSSSRSAACCCKLRYTPGSTSTQTCLQSKRAVSLPRCVQEHKSPVRSPQGDHDLALCIQSVAGVCERTGGLFGQKSPWLCQ